MDEKSLAVAFADHLRNRDGAHARRLAEALADSHDTRRAEVLQGFADRGDHAVPAPWWLPEAACHVGLQFPEAPGRGDVWFDPLDVSFFLALPRAAPARQPGVIYPERPRRQWYGWLAIEPVTAWQMRGAHLLNHDIAATPAMATAQGAHWFSDLFGKSLSMSVDWNVLRRGYGLDMLRRLWGDHDAEFGRGGPNSGSFVTLRRRQIESWDPDNPGVPDDVFRLEVLGLHFRTCVASGIGLLSPEHGALERTWHS